MNEPQPRPGPRGSARNPFPDVPEVRLGGGGATVRVETDAVRAVRRLALDFLTSRADAGGDLRNSGRVAAILGEYGAGKSHLAWALMDEVVQIAGKRPVVLVASGQPKDTVLSIHRRLLAPPGSGTAGRIRPVDTAAGVLLFGTVESMVEDLSAALRGGGETGRDASPPAASDELPVDEVWALHRRLTEIADGDEELATVLGLVWHAAAGEAAWRWLRGDERWTDEDRRLLADRGVQSPPVGDDQRAIRVLRALARLCGGTGRRMVLLLDELHMMRPQRGDGLTETAATLMELIGWAGQTGTLLAVCGLLDYWEALPQSVRERVPVAKIVPSGLTKAQIREYIVKALHPDGTAGTAAETGTDPFTEKAVEELWKITDGHPRRTITVCHHAYELARGGPIGPRQIQEASRALCAPDTPDHVREKLFRWCTELGYHVRRAPRDAPPHREPDLRVGSRHGAGECALVVSGPVVENSELEVLRRRAYAVAGGHRARPRDVVLVMAGSLAAAFTGKVEDAFAHVLYWDRDTFRDDLAATLHSYISAGDASAANAGLYELVLDLRQELRELRTPPALAPAAASVPADARSEPPEGARAWTDADRGARFMEADRLCRQALEFLDDAHGKAQEFWRGRFHFDADGATMPRSYAPGDRQAALADVCAPAVRGARGTLMFLEDAVREFAGRVRDLLGDESRPMRQIREELRYLRDKLDHSVADLIRMFPDERSDAVRFFGVDRARLNEHLAGLGETVYSAVVTGKPKDGT
ncbi:hypothetical protein ACH35V_23305 [Actinomadura sp. 1N219]|uniref:hypothetical protein n=1 Tax=Actinomadura sp. 1N219 TaxID=3375152 RepID=UPI00379BEEE7